MMLAAVEAVADADAIGFSIDAGLLRDLGGGGGEGMESGH